MSWFRLCFFLHPFPLLFSTYIYPCHRRLAPLAWGLMAGGRGFASRGGVTLSRGGLCQKWKPPDILGINLHLATQLLIAGFALCGCPCGHFYQHSSRPTHRTYIRLVTWSRACYRHHVQHGADRGEFNNWRRTGARTNPTQGTPGKNPTTNDWVVSKILFKW